MSFLRDDYQEEIFFNTLYEVKKKAPVSGAEALNGYIVSNGTGSTINIYGSTSKASLPTSLTDDNIHLPTENQGIGLFQNFGKGGSVIPNYIVITQAAGTTTELIASGLGLIPVGEVGSFGT